MKLSSQTPFARNLEVEPNLAAPYYECVTTIRGVWGAGGPLVPASRSFSSSLSGPTPNNSSRSSQTSASLAFLPGFVVLKLCVGKSCVPLSSSSSSEKSEAEADSGRYKRAIWKKKRG